MTQAVAKRPIVKPKVDRTYEGWSEYDVKEKAWELLMINGERYIKTDFKGNFMHTGTGRVKQIGDLFPEVRNCTDSQGLIIAKRKKHGLPLWQQRNKKVRIPRR